LHRQELVAESGRKGFEVTELNHTASASSFEVRGAIDALAARLAAGRVKTDPSDARIWRRHCMPGARPTVQRRWRG
jgi:DNA-binding GntR family transcriptional regulator